MLKTLLAQLKRYLKDSIKLSNNMYQERLADVENHNWLGEMMMMNTKM